ncbi:Origin recognition complex subunit 3 [Lecanora helva]
MTEYENACHVFTPEEPNNFHQRPSKRRKTGKSPESIVKHDQTLFVPLLRGAEILQATKQRFANYCDIWTPKERVVDEAIRVANDDTVNEVVSFITAQDTSRSEGKLPTALVLAEPGHSSSFDFQAVVDGVNAEKRAILVELSSEYCNNLKATLKHVNQVVTNPVIGGDEEVLLDGVKPSRYLNYDLEILYEFVQTHSIRTVVLAFKDSEAFDSALLAELIDVFSSWNDRIPFVLLFSLGTSIEFFQSKLPRDTIRRLAGEEFHLRRIDVNEIFQSLHHGDSCLYFGPTLSSLILQHHRDFIQSPMAFGQAIKYAYMTHFFANPLSILLSKSPTDHLLQKEHFEAIRNLPSFRRAAQNLIDDKDYEGVRLLLDDDESLRRVVVHEFANSRQAIRNLLMALDSLSKIQSHCNHTPFVICSDLYIQAMSASLLDSELFTEILSSFKKLPSEKLLDALDELKNTPSVSNDLIEDLAKVSLEIKRLTTSLDKNAPPLRSAYDIQHSSLRTTVIAQKVSLSTKTAELSSQDTAYTKLVDRTHNTLLSYFQQTLINPADLFLNEILIFNSQSPHREAFTPRPRFAIERALSSPHDYLGCDCCTSGKDAGLEASQPAIAILYQLYLESGPVINTADLWEAFWTIVGGGGSGGGGDEDEDEEREKALALFSRALAEMKYMGMLKTSRKKADHLQKLAWKGL